MTASQLVPVVPGTIGNVQCLTVDGRTLHSVLGVRRVFAAWIQGRIEKYGFVQGQDFEVFSNSGKNSEGGRPSQEYTCTLDMGKELCMVENNEKGRIARRYFIECERRLLSAEPVESSDQSSSSLVSVTPSSVADRKPLRSLVNAWARLSGHPFGACWNQLKAAFRLTDIRDLPQEWIPDAIAWVQAKIDALPKALPSAPSTPPAIENSRIPNAMEELRKLVTHCGMVRNIIHIECHPGAMSFSMSAKEREVHYAFQGIYQTAVDNICAATHALDACLKLRAIYPARG